MNIHSNTSLNTKLSNKKQLAYQYYQLKNQHGGDLLPKIKQIDQLHQLAGKINYSRLQGKLDRLKSRIQSSSSKPSHQIGGNFKNLPELKIHYNKLLQCCKEYNELIPQLGVFSKSLESILTFLRNWLASLEEGEIPEEKRGEVETLRTKITQLETIIQEMKDRKDKCSALTGISEILEKGQMNIGTSLEENKKLQTDLKEFKDDVPTRQPTMVLPNPNPV